MIYILSSSKMINHDRLLWECIHNQTGLLPTIIGELADLSGLDIVKAVDCSGRNALHLLCIHNRTPYLLDGIEALIWRGADVNATDLDSRNALHLLCAHNPTGLLAEIVYIFKHHGLDINAKDRDGRNVLHLLCQNIFIRCLRSAHERNLLWLGGYYLFKNPDGMEQLKSLFSVQSTRTDVVRMTHFYRPSMSWRYEYVLMRGENNLEDWLDLSDPKRSLLAILMSLKEVDVNEKDANELNALQLLSAPIIEIMEEEGILHMDTINENISFSMLLKIFRFLAFRMPYSEDMFTDKEDFDFYG